MTNRPLARAVAFCMTTVITLCFLNFIFWDDIHSLSRLTMKEMYEYDGNIDTVMLGSSYVVHGFNPKISDEILGGNSYNAGTKMQSVEGSYYMLKEILKHHEVKTVYLECSHVILAHFTKSEFGINSFISVYMKPSFDRFRFVYRSSGSNGIVKNAFPFLIRKKLNFFGVVNAKLTDGYDDGNYKYVDFDEEAYVGNGFVRKKGFLKPNDNFEPIQDIDSNEPVTGFSMEYLTKIAKLCESENIRLVLMTVPVSSEMLDRIPNAQDYIDAVQTFADSYSIEYHNYNLAKSDYCHISFSDYADKEHLNGGGADNFTRQFTIAEKAMADGNLSVADVFYPTLAEKLDKDPDETIYYHRQETLSQN